MIKSHKELYEMLVLPACHKPKSEIIHSEALAFVLAVNKHLGDTTWSREGLAYLKRAVECFDNALPPAPKDLHWDLYTINQAGEASSKSRHIDSSAYAVAYKYLQKGDVKDTVIIEHVPQKDERPLSPKGFKLRSFTVVQCFSWIVEDHKDESFEVWAQNAHEAIRYRIEQLILKEILKFPVRMKVKSNTPNSDWMDKDGMLVDSVSDGTLVYKYNDTYVKL